MQNLFAPFRGVRAQLEYRWAVRSLQAQLAIRSAGGFQIGKAELEAQSAIFAAKNHLGSFQQGFAPRLLLPKLHNANRFIAHKVPRKISRKIFCKIPTEVPAKYPAQSSAILVAPNVNSR